VKIARPQAGITRHLAVTPLIAIMIAIAIVVVSFSLAVYNEQATKAEKMRQTNVQALILAGTVAAPLAFDDKDAAAEYIGALKANPEIEVAGAYDIHGHVVAGFHQPGFDLPASSHSRPPFSIGRNLIVTAQVKQGGTVLGSVYLRTATETFARRALRYLGIAFIVIMASMLIGVLGSAYASLSESHRKLQAEIEGRLQAEEALRQSQKMEAMGQLTGGVAHDFNNLLTPIIGSLDLLGRRQTNSDRDRRLIDGALQSAERAKTLVQRLLAFARRQPLQVGPVDIAALVKGMADLIVSTSGRQIRVDLAIADDLPPALADSNQLEMALLNLCVNARDAMPEGGDLIVAATAETDPRQPEIDLAPGNYVRLSITDTGTGMDAATIKRAIEPFYSTKGIGKGTGLGLSMVHGLASQLNGDLAISSTPGAGTRIDLWLPVSQMPASGPDAMAETPRFDFHGRVLVVDDEDTVRTTTCSMLAELGIEAVEVATAREAQAVLRKDCAFDLVLTDHLMPGVTGAELARTIRATWACLPVLLVSGYAETQSIDIDIPRLTKPFRQAELARALADLGFPRRQQD
jgi:signal transduction histidine kinase/CheY-like chemotaxis protein